MIVSVSGTLLRFVDYQKEISLEAMTVQDALIRLVEIYPKLRSSLYDGEGNVRRVHRVFLNDNLLLSEELNSPIENSDRLRILTALAGG